MKKLSVIIPTYNVEEYIEECLASLLIQITDEVELIIVDDCSTDRTVEKVKECLKTFTDRYKLIVKGENKGVSDTRNIGLRNATGEYVAFIDSDDVVDRFYIKSIFDELKFGYDYYELSWENFNAMKNVRYAGSLPKNNWAVWCRIWKRSIIKVEFDVNKRTAEDHKFVLDNLNDKLSKGLIMRPIYRYRRGRFGGLTTPKRRE